jgi:hypothetical protein
MSRSVQEHWQLVEEILRKGQRDREHARQLLESVVELLATPEGRESIRRRLDGEDGSFEGRRRFVDEVFRAFENPAPVLGELSARDRLSIQEAVLKRTGAKADQAYWNMLWLLHRDGHLGIGQKVLDSLAKITKKSDDFLHALSSLQAWKRLPPDRMVTLLEAAKAASRDIELTNRLDRVLSWAKGVRSSRNKDDARSGHPSVSPDRACSDAGVAGVSALPTTEAKEAERTKPPPLPTVATREEARLTLPMLLAEIDRLFRRAQEEKETLRQERQVVRDGLTRVQEELQADKELASAYLQKAERLEQALNDRTRELAAARHEMIRLEQQLTEARQEVDGARRRADDYIHEATLARDNAVRSFQATLWERLRAYLIEVLDEHGQPAGLTPDQVFFRHRLEEIRETLRELGVPPH